MKNRLFIIMALLCLQGSAMAQTKKLNNNSFKFYINPNYAINSTGINYIEPSLIEIKDGVKSQTSFSKNALEPAAKLEVKNKFNVGVGFAYERLLGKNWALELDLNYRSQNTDLKYSYDMRRLIEDAEPLPVYMVYQAKQNLHTTTLMLHASKYFNQSHPTKAMYWVKFGTGLVYSIGKVDKFENESYNTTFKKQNIFFQYGYYTAWGKYLNRNELMNREYTKTVLSIGSQLKKPIIKNSSLFLFYEFTSELNWATQKGVIFSSIFNLDHVDEFNYKYYLQQVNYSPSRTLNFGFKLGLRLN